MSSVIAIVGRPNVGKSALFNRIARKRVAIVFDQPGVTRDRVAREVTANGRRFLLVDTGGLTFDRETDRADPLAEQTRAQAALAVEDADAVIVVTDARAGVTPLDEEVFERVRAAGVPCAMAANKCDTANDDHLADEFNRFGVPVFPTSAEHGRGVQAVIDWAVGKLPPADEAENAVPLRVVVVGRPNAGKSSYINRLLKADRVIVSEIAGTTRDVIDVPFTIGKGPEARHYILTDTAGMRSHNKASANSVEKFSLFRGEQAIAEADVAILVIDPELGPTLQDKRIGGIVKDNFKACVVMVQKWDKVQENGMDEKAAEEALRKMMPFLDFAPVVFCSNKTGYNIRRSVDAIDRAAASTRTKMPTGLLNRTIVEAQKKTLCPMKNGRRLKIYYALQVGEAPLTLRLFVNDPKLVAPAYLVYLERAIRARFGLEGAPLRIFLKARKRDSVEDLIQKKRAAAAPASSAKSGYTPPWASAAED